MRCLMFGLACDQQQFEKYIKQHKNPYSVAHYLFENKMIQQLQEDFVIDHHYILQSGNRSLKKAWIKRKTAQITAKTQTTYLSYLNLPVIKFVSLFFSTVGTLIRYHHKYKNDYFVMSTINYFPVALATTWMSRILGYKNVAVFTDCSVGYAYDKADTKSIRDKLRKIYKKAVHAIEGNYDGYILFSQPMNELVNPHDKPWCVMEGFFNPDDLNLENVKKFKKFTLVYAGTIIESVGLQNLVEAFQYIDDPDIELRIYGEGEYKERLWDLCKNDPRIRLYSFVEHSQLFEIEKAAHLMVNVRDPKLAYTKYSFPSKTFEYLASGTPFLSTKLGCYAAEYDDYVIFIPDNQPQTIAQTVEHLSKMEKSQLEKMGDKAKQFVLTEKIPSEQVKKIVAFVLALVLSLSLVACGGVDKQPAIDAFNKTSAAFNEVAAIINADIESWDAESVEVMKEMASVLQQHGELLSSNQEISEESLAEMIAWYAEVDQWVASVKEIVEAQ